MTTTAVTRVKDARENLKTNLSKLSDSFARVLPRHMTPDRMVQLALVAATKNPAILECTQESIALSVMQASQWGLDIGRTVHLVPFGRVCTAIPDWKGLVELMLRSGHVRDVKARCVYSKERFIERGGSEETLEHYPIHDPKERGELVGAYAAAILRHGRATWEFLSKDEIDRIRSRAVSKNSPAWKDHYDEMAKKTAVRRLAKRIPQTADIQAALIADELPVEALGRYAAAVGVPSADLPQLGAGDSEEAWNSTEVRGTAMPVSGEYESEGAERTTRPVGPEPAAVIQSTEAAIPPSAALPASPDGELPLGETRQPKRGRNALAEG